jgi:hypothetical protein
LGPHQPGRYSASSLLARRSARSIAAAKSASTAVLARYLKLNVLVNNAGAMYGIHGS